MGKKFESISKEIETDLKERVAKRYAELIQTLPENGGFNPNIIFDSVATGFEAEVMFFKSDGKYLSSLWEYTYIARQWRMYLDWND